MSNTSTYFQNKIVDHALGKTAFTMPQVFIGVCTTVPNINGTITGEPTAGVGGYGRITTTGASWNASAAGSASNAATLAFTASSAAWSTGATNVAYAIYMDAVTGGNLLWWDDLTTPQAVNAAGVTLSATAGTLVNSFA